MKTLLIFSCMCASVNFAFCSYPNLNNTIPEDSRTFQKTFAENSGSAISMKDFIKQKFGGKLPNGAMTLDNALKCGKLGKYAPKILSLNNFRILLVIVLTAFCHQKKN